MELFWQQTTLDKAVTNNDMRLFKTHDDTYICTNDIRRAKGDLLEEVIRIETTEPVMLCFFVEIDPKINPDCNIPQCITNLQERVKATVLELDQMATDLRFTFANPVTNPYLHEIRVENVFVQANQLPWFWNKVCTDRVFRYDNGVLRETGMLLRDRFTISTTNTLLFSPDARQVIQAPEAWKPRPSRKLQRTNNPLRGVQPKMINSKHIQLSKGFLESTMGGNENRDTLSVTPMFEMLQNTLMPRAVRIVPKATNVCQKQHPHITSYIDVRGQEGKIDICCETCGTIETKYINEKHERAFDFCKKFWGPAYWIKALNTRYTQLANGQIAEQMMGEYSEMQLHHRTSGQFMSYLKGNKYVAWELSKEKIRIGEETIDVYHMVYKDVSTLWLQSMDRIRCKSMCFNPQMPPGHNGDFFNLYHGLAIQPIPPPKSGEEAAPMFRRHLEEVICGGDQSHYQFLIKCLSKMVRYPWLKLQICTVLISKQGAGKNTFLDVMKDIFGRHGIEVTQQRHATGNFNEHLRYRIFVVLNEATWGGDKQSEGALKAAITESFALFERKGENVIEGRNHWNFFVSSNEKWCIPATTDGRRFFVLQVSDARIADHKYFSTLHEALKTEKAEFLWYLLNQVEGVTEDWLPAQHMPHRSIAMAKQILEDRSQVLLRWLVHQLEEFGEWKYGLIPIIQKGSQTIVSPKLVRMAWIEEAANDRHLLDVVGKHQKVITTFFKQTLAGELFDNRVCSNGEKYSYRFGSAEDIKAHIVKHVLQTPDYFQEDNDGSEPESKKIKN